ncbi:MAG: hydroxymethylglutaryl-CoA lyase [Hyphomonadaceae bacterium]|nr:hydroxymethylglutaryl-CoA lyase [Hyphomonadaceae bacterium]
MAETVHVREVGLRDGLQLVSTILTTEQKLEWCRRAADAGIREIEVTSFVPATVVPQFVDAEAVAQGAIAIGGCTPTALVPNLKGAQRALSLAIPKINYVVSASEDHNLANVRRTTRESVEDFARIIAARDNQSERRAKVGAGIATSFGCTLAGAVPEARVIGLAADLLALGADEIVIADTVGYADPGAVRRLLTAVLREAGAKPVACHFHDTRGLGLANVTTALDVGIRAFDASLAGLGGCPFAPGASGNVGTEDCIFLFESLGFATGVDIARLLALRRSVEAWLPGERFSGTIARAGLPKTFRPTSIHR